MTSPALHPPFAAQELTAPPAWQCIEFISDLHLQESEAQTVAAWQDYLQRSTADAIFILGDLFEVWVGDDCLDEAGSFEAQCCAAMHIAAQKRPLFFIQGNRDVLTGQKFAEHSGCCWLADPTVLDFAGKRYLLSHGDALCLADTDYQRFRATARSNAWQEAFLRQPLTMRRAQVREMRAQSQQHQQSTMLYADLDNAACLDWLKQARASTMIHGHTHRPAEHALAPGFERIVLSDWDLTARPARAQLLRLSQARGIERLAWPAA